MGDIVDWMHEAGMLDMPFDDADDEAEYDGPRGGANSKCRRCGAPIEFVHTGVRWRLYERGANKLHVCQHDVSADDFASFG